jgi:hypothetical protein
MPRQSSPQKDATLNETDDHAAPTPRAHALILSSPGPSLIRTHVAPDGRAVASVDVDGRTLRICSAPSESHAVDLLARWVRLERMGAR